MKKKDNQSKGKLTPVEQLQQKPTEFLIVGIGASAGGIQALQEFFKHVPPDSHMAYVVILHLSPDHDSQLASVLQHITQIPVKQVTEKTAVQPDHIYVVPPDRHLTWKTVLLRYRKMCTWKNGARPSISSSAPWPTSMGHGPSAWYYQVRAPTAPWFKAH